MQYSIYLDRNELEYSERCFKREEFDLKKLESFIKKNSPSQ